MSENSNEDEDFANGPKSPSTPELRSRSSQESSQSPQASPGSSESDAIGIGETDGRLCVHRVRNAWYAISLMANNLQSVRANGGTPSDEELTELLETLAGFGGSLTELFRYVESPESQPDPKSESKPA